jgi:hypothetical protein
MLGLFHSKKALAFTLVVIVIISLDAYSVSLAYPTMTQTLNLWGTDIPRDFSVYYIAAWRMLHNPSQIFTTGYLPDGEPAIYPSITPYKYTPSFLLFIAPLTALSYYQAFWVFDAFQFILLPLIAFLLYKLLEKKNPIIALIVLVAVLVLPYPMADRGISVSYYMHWAEGQAKILLSFLLLLSFYLGYKGKPVLSGIVFAWGAFDPRFAVFALPLFIFYNKNSLKKALVPMLIMLFASNFMLFYPGNAQGFLGMLITSSSTTPFYTPAWIPIVMLASIYVVNALQIGGEIKKAAYTVRLKLKK